MPSILNQRRARLLLAGVLLCLSFPAFCHGLLTNCDIHPDTVIPLKCIKEWDKFYSEIQKKENRLKDTTYKKILRAVLDNLDNLKNSIQIYTIKHVSADSGSGGTTYDIAHDVVIFNIQKKNTANFVHETTHGGQFQKGEIVFRDTPVSGWPAIPGGLGDDFDDEIAAYKAQFAYDPVSVSGLPNSLRSATSLKDIDPPWLIALRDAKDTTKYIYMPNERDGVTERHINIYSGKKDLIEAYPKADFDKMSDDYVLGNDPHYLNFPAKQRRYRLTHQTAHDSLTTPSSQPRSQ